jgi:hypothetical protein
MGPFRKLFRKEIAPGGCQRCGKNMLRTGEFHARCEKAGFVIDPTTGQVKARLGGFSMARSMSSQ